MKPLRAYINLLLLRKSLKDRNTTIDHYPVVAFVDPALYCNLRCPACPTGLQLDLRPAATLDLNLFRTLMDEIGDYLFKLYLYNWGEPLLHKQTPELIEVAKKKEIFTIVSSNFSLKFADDYLERLVKSGLDRLVVGLDGATPETYERYRRRGDFNLVRQNMQRIRAIKERLGSPTPTVVWQFLVFQHNEHEIERVKNEYREWGADDYWIGGAQMPFPPHHEGFAPSTIPEFNIYHPGHRHQKKSQQLLASGKPCTFLYGVFLMNANRKVSPCCYSPAEKHDFGEYRPEEGVKAAMNSQRFIRARALWSQGGRREPLTPEVVRRNMTRGTTIALSLSEEEIICEKCPVPYLQDILDYEINFNEKELRAFITRIPPNGPEDLRFLERLKQAETG